MENDEVLEAKVTVAYSMRNYKELYELIEKNKFPKKYHETLQNYWYNAHYNEAVKQIGRQLNNDEKDMIAERYPLPKSISTDATKVCQINEYRTDSNSKYIVMQKVLASLLFFSVIITYFVASWYPAQLISFYFAVAHLFVRKSNNWTNAAIIACQLPIPVFNGLNVLFNKRFSTFSELTRLDSLKTYFKLNDVIYAHLSITSMLLSFCILTILMYETVTSCIKGSSYNLFQNDEDDD